MRKRALGAVLLVSLLFSLAAMADDNATPKKENKSIPLKRTGKSFRLYKLNQVKPLPTPLGPLPKRGEKKAGKPKEKI